MVIKTHKSFSHDNYKTNRSSVCFMNERQPNLPEHEDCSGLQRPSTQRIRKDIRASSQFFSRRAADVVSEAYLTAMTGDRHDELAAFDLSMTLS